MIPIKLTIEGLFSYKERQTIEFDTLLNAGLFGIFGSVGSGKSTIVEAITYALYGKTERYNINGDSRYYNMMNLKSNRMLIDFEFKTGKHGEEYRCLVEGKRNSKDFDDVKVTTHKAFEKYLDEWKPIDLKDVEKAIGLNYDNFKRSIIIPQGYFKDFIELKDKDRTYMMQELFNLGKYDLAESLKAIATENENKISEITGELKGLESASEELLEKNKKEKSKLDGEIADQEAENEVLKKNEEEQRGLKKKFEEKKSAQEKYNSLISKKPNIENRQNTLNRFVKCNQVFKSQLNSFEGKKNEHSKLEKNIREDEEKSNKQKNELKELNERLDKLKPQYDNREELKNRAVELGKITEIKDAENKLVDLQNKKVTCENALKELEKEIENKTNQKNSLEAKKEELTKTKPDITIFSDIKVWNNRYRDLSKQLTNEKKKLEGNKSNINNNKEETKRLIDKSSVGNIYSEDFDEMIVKLNDIINENEKKLKLLTDEEKVHSVNRKLDEYAKNLTDGKPCPLCGAVHHPTPLSLEDIEEKISKIEEEKSTLNSRNKNLTDLIVKLNVKKSNQKSLLDIRTETNESIIKIENNIKNHEESFEWNGYEQYKDEELLEKKLDEAKNIDNKIKELKEEIKKILSDIEENNKTKEEKNKKLSEIDTNIATNNSKIETLTRQLKLIRTEDYEEKDREEIEQEVKSLNEKYSELVIDYEEASKTRDELNSENSELEGRLKANKEVFKNLINEIENLKKKLEENLRNSDFETLDEVKTILAKNLDVDNEQKIIDEFNEDLAVAKRDLKRLNEEIGDKSYDEVEYNQLLQTIDELEEKIKNNNINSGKLSEKINTLKKNINDKKVLEKELRALDIRGDNIKTMESLFRSKGFVKFISYKFLQNLCKLADKRFMKMTNQQLGLEVDTNNNFQIRDYMNGGNLRNIKSLSGGQTFQAALSLALALADNIQRITESEQNFFFIDEGFGSLDKDSLRIVMDTLRTLRNENRIVGVISHVEDMIQDIDTYLKIEADTDTGSMIHYSWKI